jgi:3-oxoacyl-[acyl-carrier-protein] synthase II
MPERLKQRHFTTNETVRLVKDLHVQPERIPASEIVLIDIEVESAFGNGEALFSALKAGSSAVEYIPEINNPKTNLAALLPTSPKDKFIDLYSGAGRKDIRRRMAESTILADALTRIVGVRSGVLDENSFKLRDDIDDTRVGTWIGGGLSPADGILDTHYALQFGTDKKGNPLPKNVSTDMYQGIRNFAQDLSSRPSMTIGSRGPSGTIMTACSTSQNNLTVAYKEIKNGYLDFAFVGGVEYCFNANSEDAMKYFTLLGATSERNDDPKHASRPFDAERDGFVPGSGAGIGLIARRDVAEKLGLPIRAVIVNAVSTTDGDTETGLNPTNVARTAAQTCYDENTDKLILPDVIVAHATSTPKGDAAENTVFRSFLGKRLAEVPVTSNKGNIGHTMGAAGMMNIMEGILIMEQSVIPHTANLEKPDPAFEGTVFVTGQPFVKKTDTVLSLNYGFGGNNSGALLRKP